MLTNINRNKTGCLISSLLVSEFARLLVFYMFLRQWISDYDFVKGTKAGTHSELMLVLFCMVDSCKVEANALFEEDLIFNFKCLP